MAEPTRSMPFDRVADEYDRTRGGMPRAEEVVAAVAPLLPADDPLLEVGVGTGLVAAALTGRGRAVAGVDLSLPMLRHAAGRIPGRVAAGDALRLPVASGSVGGVVLIHVLHVVGDMVAALAEAARAIRPAGRVVTSTRPGGSRPSSDVGLIVDEMRVRLGRADDRPDATDAVVAAAGRAGLTLAGRTGYRPSHLRLSRADAVHRIATRSWSWMWHADERTWAAAAGPAVEALRRLPDQDRPRSHPDQVTVLAFQLAAG